jgi:hypothetical protein
MLPFHPAGKYYLRWAPNPNFTGLSSTWLSNFWKFDPPPITDNYYLYAFSNTRRSKKEGGIVVRNGGSNFQKLLSQVEEGPVKLGFGAYLLRKS